MSIRQTSIIIALSTLFLGGSVVLAEPLLNNNKESSLDTEQLLAQRRTDPKAKGGQGRILQQLNLTQQQQQQLQAIKQKYQAKMESLGENIKTARQDLQRMMAGTASTKEIRSKHQQLVSLYEQMGNLRFESMLEMREILTPDQRRKFAQLMEQNRENFRQRSTDSFNTN